MPEYSSRGDFRNESWNNLRESGSGAIGLMIKKKQEKQAVQDAIKKAVIEAVVSGKVKQKQGADLSGMGNLDLEGGFGQTVNRLGGAFEPVNQDAETLQSIMGGDALGGGLPEKKVDVNGIPDRSQNRLGGFRPKSINIGGVTMERETTPEEQKKITQEKLELSPFYQENKAKRAEDLISTIETNKVKRSMLKDATVSAEKIPTGIGGRMKMWWNKMFDTENPQMEDWQKVKMVLTDAQLMNTAKTKGAISDREMELFSKAAANDDIQSVKAMKPVFEKLSRFIDSEENAKQKTYDMLYGDGESKFNGQAMNQNKSQYQVGQTISKGGKDYVVVDIDTDGEPLVDEVR
jgi:hypothetical protein